MIWIVQVEGALVVGGGGVGVPVADRPGQLAEGVGEFSGPVVVGGVGGVELFVQVEGAL